MAIVREYLASGGDPNAADAEGETLLNIAVLHDAPKIVEALLVAGADPGKPGKNGLGPLTIAALAGRRAMLERLMQANAAEPAAAGEPVQARAASPAGRASSVGGRETMGLPRPADVPGADAPEHGGAAGPPILASLAGDGELQAVLPVEPYASMTGLAINPLPRPAPASAGPPASSSAAAQPATEAGAAASAALAVGAPAAWVSAAQRRLGQLGYYKGPVTGFAGPLTADAVKRYQAVAGVPQDGIVSADLLRRIGASVETSAAPAAAAAATSPLATAAAPAGEVEGGRAQAPNPDLQQVRNALGQEFNSATRPAALRQHCQANTNAWVYDEAIGRSLFCRDVLGAPPR